MNIIITSFEDEGFADFYQAFIEGERYGYIHLIINTDGGNAHNLLAAIELIMTSKAIVATSIVGRAYSAGALLAAFGTKGHRYIAPHSSVMMHEIQIGLDVSSLKNQKKSIAEIDVLNSTVFELLEKHCEKPAKFFSKLFKRDEDLYFNAEKWVELGLCDNIGINRPVIEDEEEEGSE